MLVALFVLGWGALGAEWSQQEKSRVRVEGTVSQGGRFSPDPGSARPERI